MYKIGEKVLYGVNGVMTIVDIREECITDTPRKYYVLRSTLGRSESQVFVPADSELVASYMHPLLSKEEIDAILKEPIDVSMIEWHENNRVRNDKFRRLLELGDRRCMLAMIRAIYENGLRRMEIGKKNFLADEAAKQRAEKLLASEITVVFDIDEQMALKIVKEKIEA